MLPIDKLNYRPMAQVPAGNLIYVLRETGPTLALRVDHPPGATGTQPYPAAVVLLEAVGDSRVPVVDTGCRAQHCIDWGTRATVLWKHPIIAVARNSAERLAPGYLVLIGDQPAFSSFYPGGRGEPMYWNVLTGQRVEPGQFDFIFIAQWRLGVIAADGSFLPLADYPEAYRPSP